MKRTGNLWNGIASFAALLGAAERAAAGKRTRPDVAAFFLDLESSLAYTAPADIAPGIDGRQLSARPL